MDVGRSIPEGSFCLATAISPRSRRPVSLAAPKANRHPAHAYTPPASRASAFSIAHLNDAERGFVTLSQC
jgi:hypothetical protein